MFVMNNMDGFFDDRTEVRVFAEMVYPIRCLKQTADSNVPILQRMNIAAEMRLIVCTQVYY